MMKNVLLAFAMLIVVLTGCGRKDDDRSGATGSKAGIRPGDPAALEERYSAVDSLYESDASDRDKLAALVDFLEAYPESGHTIELVDNVVYLRGEKKGDWPGAMAIADRIRSAVADSAIAVEFDRQLVGWYGRAGMKEKMVGVTESLEGAGVIRFGDLWNAIEGAISMEDWTLAREYCAKARERATSAAWRAEWPNIEANDEMIEQAGLNRQGMVLCKDSWAMANQGDLDGALAGFEKANGLVRSSYIGIHAYGLDLYWAKTLMKKGDPGGATEKFARGALIANDKDAMVGLKAAYAALHGGSKGFDDWARVQRLAVARVADGFDLPDSTGTRRTLDGLRGKVTLLNFWSPT